MNRTRNVFAVSASVLALAGAASGQNLNAGASQPQDLSNNLFAGSDSRVIATETGNAFNAGVPVRVDVDFFDGAGGAGSNIGNFFATTNTTPGETLNFVTLNGFTMPDASAEFSAAADESVIITLSSITIPVGAQSFVVTVTDLTNTGTLTYNLDTTTPVLSDAILNAAGDQLFLVIDNGVGTAISLTNADAANALNNTNTANLSDGDEFTVNGSAIANPPTNPTISSTYSADLNILKFDITMGDVDVGDVIGNLESEIRSYLRTPVSGSATVRAENNTIVSAAWQDAIAGGGTGSLRVVFGEDIQSNGNQTFWENGGNSIDRVGGTDLSADGTTVASGSTPDSITLDVNSTTDSVGPDGLSDDSGASAGEMFDLVVNNTVGTPPVTIFGTPITTGDADTAIGIDDEIAPSLNGSPFAFLDMNSDGVPDAIGLPFDEPITPGTGSGPDVTITTIAGTVHPYTQFLASLATGVTDPTDPVNQAPNFAGSGTTTFTVTGFASQSEDSANRLMTDNVLAVQFDLSNEDLNGDGMVDGADAGLFPGTFDTGWASVEYVAADFGQEDANGNAIASGDDLATTTVNDDGMSPVLAEVWHFDGENISGGPGADALNNRVLDEIFDGGTRTDDVGDTEPDIALLVYNEALVDNGIAAAADNEAFSTGAALGESFTSADYDGIFGAGTNVVQFTDNNDIDFEVGGTLSVDPNNGIEDASGNAAGAAALAAIDRTGPYIPIQLDLNGDGRHSAFVNDNDGDGRVDNLTLFFTKNVDPATIIAGEWAVNNGFTVDTASASTNAVVLTPVETSLPANLTYTVLWSPGQINEDGDTANLVDGQDAPIEANPITTPAVDGEFTSVMDIYGTITDDGVPAPAGTQVSAMLAIQRVSAIEGTMNSIKFEISDTDSLNAMTNYLFGIEEFLYLYDNNGEMFFSNFKFDVEDAGGFGLMTVTVTGISPNLRWRGSGSTFTDGQSATQRISASGTVDICWDVLRSDDGTAASLFDAGNPNGGFKVGGSPILSSTVITGTDGSYTLHVTGPNVDFNGFLDSFGAPIITVVETVDGSRVFASTVHNATDGLGTFQFIPLQLENDPSLARTDGQFDIFLENVGTEFAYTGWNLVSNNRDSGFSTSAFRTPQIPNGITQSNVLVGTTLKNAPPVLQFGFFDDEDGDGAWTRDDDDSSLLDGVIIDPRCIDGTLYFTMTSLGVTANSNVQSIVGGYGIGFFNPEGDPLGIQQMGPRRPANATAFGTNGFTVTFTNLGWALMSAAGDASDVDNYLINNLADFLIEFNRTASDEVNITTFDGVTATGDTKSINGDQAYFLHFN